MRQRARTSIVAVSVAIATLAGCSTAPAPAPRDFSGVTCEEWSESDAEARAAFLETAPSAGPASVTYTATHVAFAERDRWEVYLVDGSTVSGAEGFADWSCTEDADSVTDAMLAALETGAPSCAEYLETDSTITESWIAAAEEIYGRTRLADDVAMACSTFPARRLDGVIKSIDSVLAEARLAVLSWGGDSEIMFATAEGYTSTITFAGRLHDFAASTVNSPPAYADITFSLTSENTHRNTTDGRSNPGSAGIAVSPVFPAASEMCQLLLAHHWDGWGWLEDPASALSSSPVAGAYCLPLLDPSELNESLGASSMANLTATREFTARIPESSLPNVTDTLAGSGPSAWVAYMNSSTLSAFRARVEVSRLCQIRGVAWYSPLVAYSSNISVDGCDVRLELVEY